MPTLSTETPTSLLRRVRRLYHDAPFFVRTLQTLRPFICPFHELISLVPPDSRILDVGCGSGFFLAILADSSRVFEAVGFDCNTKSVEIAGAVLDKVHKSAKFNVFCIDATQPWPVGPFDVVSIIDLMHHVPPDKQHSILANAAKVLKSGGILIYKDMVSRPRWRAWANRLHDLIIAHQWIYYIPFETVKKWAYDEGFKCEGIKYCNMLWYGHEWGIFRKT